MSRQVFIPILLLLCAAYVKAAPVQPPGEAEVRDSGSGIPCFTISEREERRGGAPDFQAVTVFERGGKGRAALWRMKMPEGRTFAVMHSMCIPYAGRVASLPRTSAARLEAGKVYEVMIDARQAGGTRGYGARFCLAQQRGGPVLVQQIGAGAHEGRNLFGCRGSK